MKLPNNLGLKIYLAFFTVFSFSCLLSLAIPETPSYIYYNSMIKFCPPAAIWYILAIMDAILNFTGVIVLIRRAFGLKAQWTTLFQWFFFLRLNEFSRRIY